MQKWLRYDAACNHLERYEREGEAFLCHIITLDETWAKSYEPQMKRQSNEWHHYGSPRKSKVRQNPSNVKVMVILVYDCDGVILTHTVPRQQTVNAQYYCPFLEHNLRPSLRKKRRHFLQNPPIILQDSARPHAAQAVADLFDRWGWEVLYHPPYSPDLSHCDFDLIPIMKEPLRGIRFRTVPEILQAVDRSIRTINTTGATKGWKLCVKLTTGICRSKKRLDGKTVIVTGANTGIGKETARDLAERGAKVILACRDLEKGKKACDDIIASTGNENVEVQHLDLSSLASVRKFAINIINTEPRLDVLINNAGATRVKQKLTDDGLLLGMQVNHFGPFLLTCLLTGLLKRSSPSRIVIVASLAHRFGKLDLDDLNFEKSYGGDKVYCSSKLANILMSDELARKLKGTGVTVNCLHPGVVVTDLFRNFGPFFSSIIKFFIGMFYKDAREGAQTSIYLAVSEDVDGISGKYFSDCKEASKSKLASDEGLAKKLWEKSEALVGLKPEEANF